MNKFAKGSIAAGAGVILLLGGAGSLAYWNDDANLGGGTISAGELSIDASAGAWSPQIATWVPGDDSTYSTTLTVTAEGDSIQGTIELDLGSVEITPPAVAGQFELALAAGAGRSVPTGAALAFDADSETFTFDGPGVYQIPVELSVAFPYTSSEQNASQHAEVDLSAVSFIVTQTVAGAIEQ